MIDRQSNLDSFHLPVLILSLHLHTSPSAREESSDSTELELELDEEVELDELELDGDDDEDDELELDEDDDELELDDGAADEALVTRRAVPMMLVLSSITGAMLVSTNSTAFFFLASVCAVFAL